MAKKGKKKIVKDLEAMAVPSADNAKWMGIGFLAAVVMVGIGMAILVQLR